MMNSFIIATVLVSVVALQHAAVAQVVFRAPQVRPLYEPYLQSSARSRLNFARYSLSPGISNEQLLLEEQWRRFGPAQTGRGWFQFGRAFPVDLSLLDGTW